MKFRILSGTYSAIDPSVERRMVPVFDRETDEPVIDPKTNEQKMVRETPEQHARRATRLWAAKGMHGIAAMKVEDNPQLEAALRDATDIVESNLDLCQLFNSRDPNALPKFERLTADEELLTDPSLLHQMPGESLTDFAKRVAEAAAGGRPAAPSITASNAAAVAEAARRGFADMGHHDDPFDDMTIDELRKTAEEE